MPGLEITVKLSHKLARGNLLLSSLEGGVLGERWGGGGGEDKHK